MFVSFIITFREALEAGLIIGIIYAYLSKINKTELSRYLFMGAAGGVFASFLLAYFVKNIEGKFKGVWEGVFEGFFGLLAAIVLTYMIFWMAKNSKMIKGEIQAKIDLSISKKKMTSMVLLSFIIIFREGVETVLFLGNLAVTNPVDTLIGASLGIVTVGVISFLMFKGIYSFNISKFFKYTSIVMIIFATGLVGKAVFMFQSAGLLPGTIIAWDTSSFINDNSILGSTLAALVGYSAKPTVLQVIFYFAYLAVILYLWFEKSANKNSIAYKDIFIPIGDKYDKHLLYKIIRMPFATEATRIIMLVLFVILLAIAVFNLSVGPFTNEGPMKLGSFVNNENGNNLFNFILWIIWLPLLTLTGIFLSRFWCGSLCPLGLITEITKNISDKILKPAKQSLKPYKRAEFILPISFILITYVTRVFPVQSVAFYGAVMFIVISLIAVFVTILFRRGAFCRYVCPIGGWLARLTRLSATALRANQDICSTCIDKPCLHGTSAAAKCPSFLNPSTMDSNSHCMDCWDCVKNCPVEKSALKVGFRLPGAELVEPKSPRMIEAIFVPALMGMYMAAARQGAILPDLPFTLTFFTLMIASVVVYLFLCVLVSFLGHIKLKDTIKKLGYIFLPMEFATAIIAFGDDALEFFDITVPFAIIMLGITFIWSLLLSLSLLKYNSSEESYRWRAFIPVAATLSLLLFIWLHWYASGAVIDVT
jgi:high-affinity iron transporter